MSVAELNPEVLAQQKQQRELQELADKFEKLAERMFKMAVDDGLNIKSCDVFFHKHLSLLWGAKVDKFLAGQKSKNIL